MSKRRERPPYAVRYTPMTELTLRENEHVLDGLYGDARLVSILYALNSTVADEARERLNYDAAAGYDSGFPRAIHVHRKGEACNRHCQLVTKQQLTTEQQRGWTGGAA